MHLFLDICQGIGLAVAVGMRPFLPALLAGALAAANLGLDFDHTSYAFLEQPWFLLVLVVLLILLALAERRFGPERFDAGLPAYALAATGAVLGVLLFAGSLADHHEATWPAVFGVFCAVLAFTAVRALLVRTRSRLDREAAAALPLYAEGAGLLTAGLAILLPPLGLVALALVAALAVTGRRRGEQKYAGLRILR